MELLPLLGLLLCARSSARHPMRKAPPFGSQEATHACTMSIPMRGRPIRVQFEHIFSDGCLMIQAQLPVLRASQRRARESGSQPT
mmetsp:Transcript_63436/g.174149  ORF Transcript_63436/g.174149 Transcript_63436/m.174149 type:complete len:85 (-) Transcript_63436:421-675(-)